MKAIVFVLLLVVSHIQGETLESCHSEFCQCDQTAFEIAWHCSLAPSSSVLPGGNSEEYFLSGGRLGDEGPMYVDENTRKVVLTLTNSSKTLQVDCSHIVLANTSTFNASIYDYLPKLNIGPLKEIKFRFCPLPEGSFRSFLTRFNITQIDSLYFSYSVSNISTLSAPYFDDLPFLEYISLTDNSNLNKLESNLFRGTPQLKNLYLRGNSLTQLDPETFQSVLQLEILDVGNNQITHLDSDTFRNLTSLRILNIDHNQIVNLTRALFSNVPLLESLTISGNNISVLPSDVFADLGKLRKFQANKNRFQTFPGELFSKNTNLREIKIAYHKNSLVELPSGLFSNLPQLTTVLLHESGIQQVPEDLFWNSPKLASITLSGHRNMTTIAKDLLRDCAKLNKLDLSSNKLRELPSRLFMYSQNLKTLDLRRNQIETITKLMFVGLDSLQELYLSFNSLKEINTFAFEPLKQLSKVDLSNNLLQFEPNLEYSPLKSCTQLVEIDLSHNHISWIYSDWFFSMTTLEKLDLRENNFTFIPDILHSIVSDNLVVDLSLNNITTVDLRSLELVAWAQGGIKVSKREIILDDNPIACNCSSYDLFRYLNKNMSEDVYKMVQIQTNNVKCEGDVDIDAILPESVECSVESRCPKPCTCNFMPYFAQMRVNCSSANLTEMPDFLPVSYEDQKVARIQLVLRNNSIQHLLENPPREYDLVTDLDLSRNKLADVGHMQFYLSRLEKLDLSHNHLNSVSQDFLNVSATLGRLALFGNPWTCNCNIGSLFSFVLDKHNILIDAENIVCEGWEKPLNKMSSEDFCVSFARRFMVAIVSLGTLGFLFGLLMAFYYKYEHEIKVWMYAHKILLWCFTEDDRDSDKVYDAFVSFSNDDLDFVMNTLIPGLEKDFQICHHFRDFLPGEWIHNQIHEKVQASRRTIIVLSQNFLKSDWGALEFRVAHAQAARDNCARVIILIHGAMPPQDQMEEEMKAYMRTNTYIKTSDPWFWHNLRYVLPHAPSKPSNKIAMQPVPEVSITMKSDVKETPQGVYTSEIMKKG